MIPTPVLPYVRDLADLAVAIPVDVATVLLALVAMLLVAVFVPWSLRLLLHSGRAEYGPGVPLTGDTLASGSLVDEVNGDAFQGESELPGMWSESDFTGGDPDERSHADRSGGAP